MTAFSYGIFAQGGPVMWLLLLLGLAGLVIFMERALFLHRGQIRSTEFLNGIKNMLQKGRLMEALTLCEETPGPIAAVVKAGLRHAGDDEQAMRFALSRQAITQMDNAYKQMIAGKPAAEQIFRQNEMLLEYEKLMLTMPYVPLPARTVQAPGAPASETGAPKAAPPPAVPPKSDSK